MFLLESLAIQFLLITHYNKCWNWPLPSPRKMKLVEQHTCNFGNYCNKVTLQYTISLVSWKQQQCNKNLATFTTTVVNLSQIPPINYITRKSTWTQKIVTPKIASQMYSLIQSVKKTCNTHTHTQYNSENIRFTTLSTLLCSFQVSLYHGQLTCNLEINHVLCNECKNLCMPNFSDDNALLY